jgi:hypothetical protein
MDPAKAHGLLELAPELEQQPLVAELGGREHADR